MLTFFEVQTLEDWEEIAFKATDASDNVDFSPVKDNQRYVMVIFVLFIFVSHYFLLNIIITVLITNY
jgi:hypothetical protein